MLSTSLVVTAGLRKHRAAVLQQQMERGDTVLRQRMERGDAAHTDKLWSSADCSARKSPQQPYNTPSLCLYQSGLCVKAFSDSTSLRRGDYNSNV